MRFRLLCFAVIATMALASFPALACASDQDQAELVGRTVTTVSGTELADELLDDLERVELGPESTTVSLDVDGEKRAVEIEYDELLSGAGVEGGTGGIVPLALISAGLGILFKLVRLLSRLAQ